MLAQSNLIAFVSTAHPERARAFYEGLLGLTFVADEPFALVFDSNGTTLRVTKVPSLNPASYTALGWSVTEIRGAVLNLSKKGITFERYEGLTQDDLGVWTTPSGGRVAWFKDPDDNVLSLTQA